MAYRPRVPQCGVLCAFWTLSPDTPLDASLARRNRLLATLPAESLDALLASATIGPLAANTVLSDFGTPIESIYFPLGGVVALMAGADDTAIEVAAIGREGMVGFPAIADTDRAALRSVVRDAGEAVCIDVETFRERMGEDTVLRAMLRRYVVSVMTHLAQSVICNRIHRISARSARWLLESHDRADAANLAVTQEFVAQMLGVRRASVTVAAGALQKAGAIKYTRGRIQVLDRGILEREACACYRIIRDEYERLLPLADEPAAV